MNKQQRLLLIIFIAVVVVLVAAIVGVNLSRRSAVPDPVFQQTAEPTAALPALSGKTEEEMAAMALEEESGDDYVSAFDDEPIAETLDPDATAEPID